MKKKKVVLYNPLAVFFDMPLALLALGSNLDREKYEVIIIDARVDENVEQKVMKACKDALCFGVTVLTGRPLRDALQMTKKVKQIEPNLPVIWGGWHPSLFAVEILEEEPAVDITVFGQGEITFKELVHCLDKKGDLSQIQGIAYRNASGLVMKNLKRHLVNMNKLQATDYSLINVEAYFKKEKKTTTRLYFFDGLQF